MVVIAGVWVPCRPIFLLTIHKYLMWLDHFKIVKCYGYMHLVDYVSHLALFDP